MTKGPSQKLSTKLVHAGRSASSFGGMVNPPIEKASTLLAPDSDGLYSGSRSLYGRMGMRTQSALIDGLNALENAAHTQLASCGLNACSLALASVVGSGDHLIASDSIYGPTRRFCEKFLKRMGVETDFFNPRDLDQLKGLIRPETKAIFLEAPGSLTFELHDLSAIVDLAAENEIITLLDNTWGAGVFLKPLDWGVSISIQALTKYVIGHSDGFGGAVMTNDKRLAHQIDLTAQEWGISMPPEDAYLAARGLRSLPLRIESQGRKGIEIANWLEAHPKIDRVFHPALTSHPDHAIWQKYFSGAAGLFSFTLKPEFKGRDKPFYDAIQLFGFGFSWGGFESLMIPCDPQLRRTETPEWNEARGPLVRVNIGMEDSSDLIADLEQALDTL